MMSGTALTREQENEAQLLAERIRQAAGDEFLQMARLLVGKKTNEIFGATEFEVRDILVRVGAKVYEEYLREKKTAMKEQA
jgi:parvulin-like peptidyl-prolyl isomerase